MGSNKKKGTKMSLGDFLADQSKGSWADEMDDLPSAPAAAYQDSTGNDDSYRRDSFGRSGAGPSGGFSGGRSFSRDSRNEPRDSRFTERSSQPLPTSPPYTAHLGNLPYDLHDRDIEEFFSGAKITGIRILHDRDNKPKGFGYVEFADVDSLQKALDMSGGYLRNRPIRVSVAEPPREQTIREDRTAGEWRRAAREPPAPSPRQDRFGDRFGHRDDKWGDRGGFRDRGRDRVGDRVDRRADSSIDRGNDRGSQDRHAVDTDWKGGAFTSRPSGYRERRQDDRYAPPPPSSSPPPVRKRLELKPRTVAESSPPEQPSSTTSPPSATVSPPSATVSPPSATVSSPSATVSPPSATVSPSSTTASPPSITAALPVTTAPPKSKPNPFGDAKPIDSDGALRRVEERRRQRDKEREEKGSEDLENGEKVVPKQNGDAPQ